MDTQTETNINQLAGDVHLLTSPIQFLFRCVLALLFLLAAPLLYATIPYVLTTLRIDSDGKVSTSNVAVTFDIHEAEAHRNEDVSNDFQVFSVAADWLENAEQSKLVEAMREFRAMVREWQQEALR